MDVEIIGSGKKKLRIQKYPHMYGQGIRTFTKGQNWLAGWIIIFENEMIPVWQFLLKTHHCPACYSFLGVDLSGWEIRFKAGLIWPDNSDLS